MAQAPDISTVYQFENLIESTVASFLNTLFGFTVTKQRDGSVVGTPRVTCKLTVGASQEHLQAVTFDSGIEYRNDTWKAQLKVGIITNRKLNTAQHISIRGYVRAAMFDWNNWQAVNLLYHELKYITDTGTSPAIFEQDNQDVSWIDFEITFSIRPGAWPQSSVIGTESGGIFGAEDGSEIGIDHLG